MAEAKRPPQIKVMTPKGIAKFPVLNKPDTKFNPEGDYKIGVILSAEEAAPIVKKLEAEAQKAYGEAKAELTEKFNTEKGEKKAKAKKALEELKMGDLPSKAVYDEAGNETGEVCLTFKMKATRKDKEGKTVKMAPKLFDSQGNVFPASKDIWGGSVVKVSGAINAFYIPGTNIAGVGLRLNAVQIIQLNTSGGGNASSYGFGKEEGGYEAEDEEVPEGNDSGDTDGDPSDF